MNESARRILSRVMGGAVLLVSLGASTVMGQTKNPQLENPRYGATEEDRKECLKNTSYYQEYYKQDNYRDAAHSWAVVYTLCPRSSENVFIRGLRMIKSSIDAELDPVKKTELIDSMMRIYDKRIEYFKKKGQNLAQKGLDLYQYAPERTEQVYNILSESLLLEKDKSDERVYLVLMQTTKDMFQAKKLTADSVIATYSALSDAMAKLQTHAKDDEERNRIKSMSEAMDALFTSTGVASCDNLVSIYTPKVEAAPNDVALARAVFSQLSALRCTDAPVYLTTAVTLFKDKPDAALGREIAKIYAAKRNLPEADNYFRKACAAETDSTNKAGMLLEYATFVGNTMGEMGRARSLAQQALQFNPKLGLAYFFIGSLYGGTRNCGSNELANQSVYWAAVDKFVTAKTVDPSLTDECNKQIAFFTQYFPSREAIFFQDLEVGKTYQVPCWINEATTIRSRD